MRLYSEFDESAAIDRADDWSDDETLEAFSDYVEETVSSAGRLDPEAVTDRFDGEDDPDRRRYGYLRGIDAALQLVHPAFDAPDRGALDELAVRFRRYNRLNSNPSDGALLPRFVFPDRHRDMPDHVPVETKSDLFEFVCAVDTETWASTESTRIGRLESPPATVRLDGVVIGCAPMCGGDDLSFSFEPPPPRRRYRVLTRTEGPLERIEVILQALESSGAQIAVMPELTLNGELLAAWTEALATIRVPQGSQLRLILVGTGNLQEHDDGRTANRAVLLDRAGRILMEQDKRHPFALTPGLIADWGLDPELGTEAAAEPIVPGKTIRVAEGTFGRLIMLVCEDLSRIVADGSALSQLGPSLCLAPVLSKPNSGPLLGALPGEGPLCGDRLNGRCEQQPRDRGPPACGRPRG